MFSHSPAQHSDTPDGGTSMRQLKYVPRIACAALLLLASFAATPALAQTTVNLTVTNSGGGIIDFGTTGYFQIRTTVPAGAGDANAVVINGVFTPGNSSPTASLTGFGSGANGANCVSPDPAVTPSNPNTFRCVIGEIINGTQVSNPALPRYTPNLQRRVLITQPAPPNRPASCPPTEHAGDLMVTMTAQNAPTVAVNRIGHDTEDFADVDVSVTGVPDHANVGDTITANITIHNFGPCAAEHICIGNVPVAGLVWQSNAGDCTKPYGTCSGILIPPPNPPTYDATKECGFPQFVGPPPPGDNLPGFLDVGQSFHITSVYKVDPLSFPGSLTNQGNTNEFDVGSDTNLFNYGTHTTSTVTLTTLANESSCNLATTGGSSIAVIALALFVAHAFNRRRRR
jgi:Domain of unknown function DUF11